MERKLVLEYINSLSEQEIREQMMNPDTILGQVFSVMLTEEIFKRIPLEQFFEPIDIDQFMQKPESYFDDKKQVLLLKLANISLIIVPFPKNAEIDNTVYYDKPVFILLPLSNLSNIEKEFEKDAKIIFITKNNQPIFTAINAKDFELTQTDSLAPYNVVSIIDKVLREAGVKVPFSN